MPLNTEELCQDCKKEVYTVHCHGVRNGQVYSEQYCGKCFGRKHHLGETHMKRLTALEETIEAPRTPLWLKKEFKKEKPIEALPFQGGTTVEGLEP